MCRAVAQSSKSLILTLSAGALCTLWGTLLGGSAHAQKGRVQEPSSQGVEELRLSISHRLGEPLIYLARRAPKAGELDVMPLLNDPDLRELLGLDLGEANRSKGPDGKGSGSTAAGSKEERDTRQLFAYLQKMLTRKADALELSLMDLRPRFVGGKRALTDQPTMVFRSQLRPRTADIVRDLLRNKKQKVAFPSRKLFGNQVYTIRSTGRAGSPMIEVALIGRNFLASNHPPAMDRLLDPKTRADHTVLERKKEYKELKSRVHVPPGSLLVYANLKELRPQLPRLFGGDASWLLSASGLTRGDRLMLVTRPRKLGRKQGIVTTAIMTQPKLLGRGPIGRGPIGRGPTDKGRRRSDSWLDAVIPTRPRLLLNDMPAGGVAGITVNLDLERLLTMAPRRSRSPMGRLLGYFWFSCGKLEVDVRKHILRRLDKQGSAQLIVVPAAQGSTDQDRTRLAYAFQARSAAAARELYTDLKRSAEAHRLGKVKKTRGVEMLAFEWPEWRPGNQPRHWRRPGWNRIFMTATRGRLVIAFDADVLALAAKGHGRRGGKNRTSTVMQRLSALNVSQKKVAGVVAFDLGRFAEHIRRIRKAQDGDKKNNDKDTTTTDREPSTARNAQRGLFSTHGGYFVVEEGFIRLEVFTVL